MGHVLNKLFHLLTQIVVEFGTLKLQFVFYGGSRRYICRLIDEFHAKSRIRLKMWNKNLIEKITTYIDVIWFDWIGQ